MLSLKVIIYLFASLYEQQHNGSLLFLLGFNNCYYFGMIQVDHEWLLEGMEKREMMCRWWCNLCLVQLLSNLFKSDTLIDISKDNMSSCSKMQEFACCVFNEEENKISADREYVI